MEWYQFKLFLGHASGVDMATFHVLVGVPVQLTVALVLGLPVTRWIPWLAVLMLEIVNEWIDLRVEKWPDPGMQYGNGVNDILLTMLLPTLILAVGRLRPGILVEAVPRLSNEDSSPSSESSTTTT